MKVVGGRESEEGRGGGERCVKKLKGNIRSEEGLFKALSASSTLLKHSDGVSR